MRKLFRPFRKIVEHGGKSSWKIVYRRFRPVQEGLREALCTLGNGYFATRGAAAESSASRIHYPGTYIAGVYNKVSTTIAGRTVFNEDFVNCPNWLLLTFKFGRGNWVSPSTSKILFYRKELDMRRGSLIRKMRLCDRKGKTTMIETQRIVHMQNPHYAAIRYVITPQNYEGKIVVKSALDGTVQNTGVARYRQLNSKHLEPVSLGAYSKEGIYLSMKTSQSAITVSQAAKIRIYCRGGRERRPQIRVLTNDKKEIWQEFELDVYKKEPVVIEKIVSLYTSKDKAVTEPQSRAINAVKKAPSFDELFKSHKHAWDRLWKKFDIRIEGDNFCQKVVRLHIFHLLQTASFHNVEIDAGLPARGLHGEAYRGHIFWDGIFTMPFFDYHAPQISKALLLYRYRRLGKAREYAKKNGYRGAMFPWQSGSTGEEETQVIHLNPMSGKWGPDHSRIQRHVSFAIGYNVWQYWKRTGDIDFLMKCGAEIILSIAQFGSSLVKYEAADAKYHTKGIMGPDEFHEKFPGSPKAGLKDDAYTNVFIVHTLLKAREILFILPQKQKEKLLKKLEITEKELLRWKDIVQNMNIIINDEGIISQFDGYFQLKELDWAYYRKKYGNIQRMDRILKAEGKSPDDYKISKQADVIMLFYLFYLSQVKDLFNRLGFRFDKDMMKKNYDYYISRTTHGSTLSKVVHCYVSHLVKGTRQSWKWFLEVLKSDIYDTQGGTTPEGIHMGVMGGSLDIIMRGFAGINILGDRIKIEPRLPARWQSLKLNFLYRKNRLSLSITKRQITILIRGIKGGLFTIPVEIYGKKHYLISDKTYKVSLKKVLKEPGAKKVLLKMVKERILIVDGDITFSEMLQTRLQARGYMVDSVRRADKALDILNTEWVNLIVLDVSLQEGMSGYHLFKEIKSRKEFSKIPVVVHCSKPGMKHLFEEMGAETVFLKPYSVEVFLNKIKDILAEKI
ncbi:MAG: response regulator [Candidatus Omnitrophota bacterium]|nr:MAG: response regulator [Candidatus Omnitrophota bacterium]